MYKYPCLLAAGAILAAGQSPETAVSQEAIERVVHDYLLKNPSVIRQAMDALRTQEQLAASGRIRQIVAAEKDELFGGQDALYIGSADPDVTLVEFFDYRCGYCKQLAPALQKLVESDAKVRVVLKEFPVLGPQSEFAARVALAARKAGRYALLHQTFMSSQDLSAEGARALARQAGIDEKALAGIHDAEVDDILRKTAALADRLEIQGTPAVVIGGKVLPGAVNLETLTALVAAERARGKAAPAVK